MKITRSLASCLLALAAIVTAPAQPAPLDEPLRLLSADSDTAVAVGMSREAVAFLLGMPGDTLGVGLWIYWDFRAKGDPGLQRYDTLVVVFRGDHVAALRACDGGPVRELLARHQAVGAPRIARAK